MIAIQRLLIRHGDRRSALTIHWVKAHVGTSGNERADELAKDCLADDAILVQVDAPMSFVKRCLLEAAYANWNTKWTIAQHGRWTSFFFPSIGHRKRAGKLPLDFVVTQFLSGHGKFGSYLFGRMCRDDPSCLCGDYQDCEHLIFNCPLLEDDRTEAKELCTRDGLPFNMNTLPHVFLNHSLSNSFTSLFHSIHRKLVQWESETYT